jgi:urease accessory protein
VRAGHATRFPGGGPGHGQPARDGQLPGARNRVTAQAEVLAETGPGGVTRLPVLRSQAPLVLRRTPEAVYLVSAAAGPLGGDQLSLAITVSAGASLRLRTVAASVALPGLDDAESQLTVTASVAAGGHLEYLPEPAVVAGNARHAADIRVTLAEGACLVLRDELILGRHGERGGSYRGSLRVDYAGSPLLRQSLEVSGTDDAARGPAVLAGHRACGTLLRVGHGPGDRGAVARAGPHAAVMPLATGPAVLVTALANDAVTLRQRLACPGG